MCRALLDELTQVKEQLGKAEEKVLLLTTEVNYQKTMIRTTIDEHDVIVQDLERRALEREQVCS